MKLKGAIEMKNSKKLVLAFIAVLLLVFAAACSSDSSGTTNSNDEKNSNTDATEDAKEEPKDEETFSVNIAYGNQPGEPVDLLAKKWKELAEEKSEGRLELNLYPSSQLGAEKDVVEQAIMGNNVVVLAGYDFLMDYVPDAGILTAPYLVDSMDDLLYLTTTDWFDGIRNELRDQKVEIVSTKTVYGERHLMTNDKVLTPDDLKGLKIRVPNNQMSIKAFEAMGAAATPTPLSDLYTSLQQGLVDGAENPLPVLQGVKAHEVSKHLSLTGHQKFITAWIGGTDFIETLPEDLVKILTETGDEAGDYGRGVLDEQTASVMVEFEAAGVEIHEVDTELFKEKAKSMYGEFPEWTPGLYDTIQDLLKNR